MTTDPWVPASALFGLLTVVYLAPLPIYAGLRWLRWAAS